MMSLKHENCLQKGPDLLECSIYGRVSGGSRQFLVLFMLGFSTVS